MSEEKDWDIHTHKASKPNEMRKGEFCYIKSTREFGQFCGGNEIDVSGELGLYDIENDVVTIGQIQDNVKLSNSIDDLRNTLTEIAQHNGCSAVLKKIASDALEVGR